MKLCRGKLFVVLALTMQYHSIAFTADLPNSALTNAHGISRAHGDGGSALAQDLSSIDKNPAGIGLGLYTPDYILSSGAEWAKDKLLSTEVGAVDTSTSTIAGAAKMRATTLAGGGKNQRYSLALAEKFEGSQIIFGAGGDFDKYDRAISEDKKHNWRLRFGAIASIFSWLRAGIFSSGYFDDTSTPLLHGFGLAVAPFELLSLSTDCLFIGTSASKLTGGITIIPIQWLDLSAGYGYAITPKIHSAAVEVGIQSAKVRLSYSAKSENIKQKNLVHLVGVTMSMLGLQQDKSH